MKKLSYICLILALTISVNAFSQKAKKDDKKKIKSGLEKKFDDADYDYSIEDYYSALKKYLTVLKSDSMNANVNYCVGRTYMKTKFDKKKAIPYLEKAVTKASKKYDEGTYEEKKAYYDCWLLLGQAYRLNNQIDKAIDAFNNYKKYLHPKDNKNNSIVDNEIEACNNAKNKIKSFSSVSQIPVQNINSNISDFNAVSSLNENVIIFARQQLEGKISDEKKVMVSRKVKGKWSEPVNINNMIKTKENMLPTYISPDGKYMLLVENEDGNTAIYESYLTVTKKDSAAWSHAKKLNKNINTGKVSHASLSPDGNTIYFTSDRKGGLGGLDIYKSVKDKKNDWGPAVNLGPRINTSHDEESPFYTSAGVLYFSSAGHASIGGLDIFLTKLNDKGEWGIVESLGYMFNTTDDDYFYFPIGDGKKALVSQTGDDAVGEKDIYKTELIDGGQDTEIPDGFNVKAKESNPEKK